MIRTTEIQADCVAPGDFYVEFQRRTLDCHVLCIRDVSRTHHFTPDNGWVRLTSASGETRRFKPDETVHVMVRT
jgi:hypothetical protein